MSQATLNIVFPIYCHGCGIKLSYNNENYLCQGCLQEIRPIAPPFCIRCGKALNGNEEIKALCPSCIDNRFYFERAWQCCQYEGLIKELIHKFKYQKKLFLKKLFAQILYNFTKGYIDYKRIDGIVPVPMHKHSMIKRGFNHASCLSQGLSALLGLPCHEDYLLKIKKTAQQANLNRQQRLKNIKDAFFAKKGIGLTGKSLLLVDDVFTTGATANECSRALCSAGAKGVYVLSLARGI